MCILIYMTSTTETQTTLNKFSIHCSTFNEDLKKMGRTRLAYLSLKHCSDSKAVALFMNSFYSNQLDQSELATIHQSELATILREAADHLDGGLDN